MADARRIGEISGPMIARLLALRHRRRLSWVAEADIEDRWTLGLEIREQTFRVTYCIAIGTLRLGLAWRRV